MPFHRGPRSVREAYEDHFPPMDARKVRVLVNLELLALNYCGWRYSLYSQVSLSGVVSLRAFAWKTVLQYSIDHSNTWKTYYVNSHLYLNEVIFAFLNLVISESRY